MPLREEAWQEPHEACACSPAAALASLPASFEGACCLLLLHFKDWFARNAFALLH